MELDKWITTNKLVVSNPNQSLYVIEDFGSFLFLEPKEEKIIDKDFGFVLDDVDVHRIEKYKPKYFLFEFGERYYYSPIETYKNSKGQQLFKVYFNNFQNISSCSEECFFEDFCQDATELFCNMPRFHCFCVCSKPCAIAICSIRPQQCRIVR